MGSKQALLPGTRVQFDMGGIKGSCGVVIRHMPRLGHTQRQIYVRWDNGKTQIVSAYRLRELTTGGPMYVDPNYPTKKALKDAVARGDRVMVFAPGLGSPPENGTCSVEGPHSPEPHKWWARVTIAHGLVVGVK